MHKTSGKWEVCKVQDYDCQYDFNNSYLSCLLLLYFCILILSTNGQCLKLKCMSKGQVEITFRHILLRNI